MLEYTARVEIWNIATRCFLSLNVLSPAMLKEHELETLRAMMKAKVTTGLGMPSRNESTGRQEYIDSLLSTRIIRNHRKWKNSN